MQTHNVKWKVSLSDGSTHYECKGIFLEIKGKLSPWQKLLVYLKNKKLKITSLSLFTDYGQNFHIPSSGTNPKFRQFLLAPKPINYKMFRACAREIDMTGKHTSSELFTVAEAIYQDHSLQLWVDEANPKNCWTLIAR